MNYESELYEFVGIPTPMHATFNVTAKQLIELIERIARIEREECAKIADEAKLNAARIGSMHHDDSPSRDRMFARSIEAGYIADEIRSKA